eukprot:TRINITY_DN6995_c0_g1_i1.p2 TRINITY_DN6995_c0_g1~~TRINITY_DN6995_c0_g1_i1.p2  ORF type:complete len:221 (-),score=34.81 TRINITY_DN6995_c0_g1_i1:51-713(-)
MPRVNISPLENFQVYVQLVISALLNPNFLDELRADETEAYFTPCMRKIEDAVCCLKEFVTRSSAWSKEFRKDLETRPSYRSTSIGSGLDCQACNRSGHPSAFSVELAGVPYDAAKVWRGLIMPPSKEEDASRPPKPKLYHLGRFCHERTQLFHALQHYKFKLFRKVEKKMSNIDSKTRENEVVNRMLDDQDWVNYLYQDYKMLLDRAKRAGTEGFSKDAM